MSDDPVSISEVTGALVAGCAVTYRRERSQTPPGYPPVASVKEEDIKDEGGRCPLKVDATVSQLLLNRPLLHLNTCSSQDHTDDKLVVSPATPAAMQDTVTQGFFNIEMPRLRADMRNLHVSWMVFKELVMNTTKNL